LLPEYLFDFQGGGAGRAEFIYLVQETTLYKYEKLVCRACFTLLILVPLIIICPGIIFVALPKAT
jgi:hypothetical protein